MPRLTYLIVLGCFFWISIGAKAEPAPQQITFARHLPSNSFLRAVIPTRDGGLLAVGGGGDSNFAHPIAIRIDRTGRILWKKEYRMLGPYSGSLRKGLETEKDGFVLIGTRELNNSLESDPIVLKINARGDLIWKKVIEGAADDLLYEVVITNDGGYLLGGDTASYHLNSFTDAWIVKLSSQGNLIWSRVFTRSGVEDTDDIRSIIKVPDGFLLIGSTDFFSRGPSKALVLKIDTRGNVRWHRMYFKSGGHVEVFTAAGTSDGGAVIAGIYVSSLLSANLDAFLIRIRSNGSILWKKTFGGAGLDEAMSVSPSSDGGFLIVGNTNSTGFGGTDGLILKVNKEGRRIWGRVYGKNVYDGLEFISLTADNGFVATGLFDTIFPVVLKLNSFGLITGCDRIGAARIPVKVPALSVATLPLETLPVTIALKNLNTLALPLSIPIRSGCITTD